MISFSAGDKTEADRSIDQEPSQVSESYAAASLSKGTILFLLAVGVIGALGVSRTKKDIKGPTQRNAAHDASEDKTVNEEPQKLIVKNS